MLPTWFIEKFEGSFWLFVLSISSVNWGWKLEHFLSFWEVMLGGGSQALTDRKEQNHWSRIQNSSHYMDSSTPHLITQAWKSNTSIWTPPAPRFRFFPISFKKSKEHQLGICLVSDLTSPPSLKSGSALVQACFSLLTLIQYLSKVETWILAQNLNCSNLGPFPFIENTFNSKSFFRLKVVADKIYPNFRNLQICRWSALLLQIRKEKIGQTT